MRLVAEKAICRDATIHVVDYYRHLQVKAALLSGCTVQQGLSVGAKSYSLLMASMDYHDKDRIIISAEAS